MKEIGLIDVWRELNPQKKDYTFFSNPHSRIDYFFTFNKELHRVVDCSMGTMDLSDHSPIYLRLNIEQQRRDTLWRLNNYVLGIMKEQIKKDIGEYWEQNDNGECSPPILWDACKAVLRGKIIGYSAHLKRNQRKNLEQKQTELKQLERDHKDTNNQEIKEQLTKKRNEINEIYTKEIQKKLIITKQKYYEGGGKASKMLAFKLKKQQAVNSIHKIRNPLTKVEHTKLKDIQSCFETYYQKLYSQPQFDQEKMDDFFNKIQLPKLTKNQSDRLAAEITKGDKFSNRTS